MSAYSALVKLLIQKGLTIATAESCTGGLVAKLITDVPGSSAVFIGGVVSYSNAMKIKWLGVKQETLEQYGAVSEHTVAEMLTGIVNETGSDVAVAVSGIAGPTGGTLEKPVGTVIIGVAFHDFVAINKFLFTGSRNQIRKQSAANALQMIKRMILDHGDC